MQYDDNVRTSAKMLASSKDDLLWAYWQKQLAGDLPVLNLPTDKPRPLVQIYRDASVAFKLSADLNQRVKSIGSRYGVTLYMTLLAAFHVLLHRYTGQDDLLVGSPVVCKDGSEITGLVGGLVNWVVLRADVSENPKFEAFLSQVHQTVLSAFEHKDYPFALLVERLQPIRDLSRSPLFQVMFVLQEANHMLNEKGLAAFALGETGARVKNREIELESFALEQWVAQFDLTLTMLEVDGALAASFEYNADLFDAATITRMVGHFQTLLKSIVTNPQQRISELPLLTAAEGQMLREWNDTQAEFSLEKCIHQLFEAQVERTPEAVAVVFENQQLTYRELNFRANQLAHYLQTLGIGLEVLVGICVERSMEMVVGLLGILKAGGAYVPLDPAYPQERLDFMLADSQVPILLTTEKLVAKLPKQRAHVVCLDKDWGVISQESAENPVSGVKPENLAYVIYTSGSTGKPKGVAMKQLSLVNLILWQLQSSAVSKGARTLQFAPVSFDVSFQEIFSTWCSGGILVLLSEEVRRDTVALLGFLIEENVERLFLPFVALQQLAEVADAFGQVPSSLREIITAGEQLKITPAIASLFRKLEGCTLHNQYGPSESHAVTSFTLTGSVSSWPALPSIGRPIANTQIYLLNQSLQPVPIGVPGELYISGACLARGYLNRPDLTKEKFISSPFSNKFETHLYKTGDLARYLPDGNIEFLGRIDHQVKIRGFRIELGEIEAVLSKHSTVRETVVMAREDVPGDKRLVAYVVPNQEPVPTISDLRHFLKEQLPEYMVPFAFMILDALPLTPSGKVDRRGLPMPDRCSKSELEGSLVAPRNSVEEVLAVIWAEVFGLKQVGVSDNFFELGGHSLLATQIISRIRNAFQVELPLGSLFEQPTIEALALVVTQSLSKQKYSRTNAIDRINLGNEEHLLAKLAQFSDEEVDLLLENMLAEEEVSE